VLPPQLVRNPSPYTTARSTVPQPKEPAGLADEQLNPPPTIRPVRPRSAWQRCRGFLWRERLLHAALATVLLAVWIHPHNPRQAAVSPERMALLEARAAADCLWAGDSRIGAAMQADQLAAALGEQARVCPFGFPLARFTTSYLDGMDRLLGTDREPPSATGVPRIIILGITPHSVTQATNTEDWFERLCATQRLDRLVGFRVPPPVRIDDLLRPGGLTAASPEDEPGNEPAEVAATLSTAEKREQATRREMAWCRRNFADLRVSEELVRTLLTRVARWSAAGIHVYAFRPPTSDEMLHIEACIHFDDATFAERFRAAGGTWIDFPQTGYETSDGHHLAPAGAEQLTRELSAQIARDLARSR